MCTVTIIPLSSDYDHSCVSVAGSNVPRIPGPVQPGGFRLACNRDESRRRPAARLPEIRKFQDRRAILPIDPISDGTWIAVNDRGLVMTLLNVYPDSNKEGPRATEQDWGGAGFSAKQSRGIIIPALLSCPGASAARDRALNIDATHFPPFRLIIVDSQTLVEVRGNGQEVWGEESPLVPRPLLFTSSGLGDEKVEGPRRALLEEMFSGSGDWPAVQDSFHWHQWPDRPDISVRMARETARTVSHTWIEVQPPEVRLSYSPATTDRPLDRMMIRLARETGTQQ